MQALEDKNRIWGYISSGCNSDGRSSTPITNPSSESQQSLIMQTFKEANMPQHLVQYVEMHGELCFLICNLIHNYTVKDSSKNNISTISYYLDSQRWFKSEKLPDPFIQLWYQTEEIDPVFKSRKFKPPLEPGLVD